VLADLIGGEVVDVSFSSPDELQSPLVELGEVVGGVAEAVPLEAEPAYIFLDGVDVLLLLFFRVRVVEAQVGLAADFVGEAEVDADGLGVADVEVAYFLVRTSSAMMSRRKLEGVRAASIGATGLSGFELVITAIHYSTGGCAQEERRGGPHLNLPPRLVAPGLKIQSWGDRRTRLRKNLRVS
jgi:hypothetical protein